MNEFDIKNVINVLEADKADLQNQIEQIELIIDRHRSQLMRLEEKKNPTGNQQEALKPMVRTKFPDGDIFPHKAHLHHQIEYVLNFIGRAVRKPDLQKEYNRLSGKDKKISNAIRKMKINKKLVTAKFNHSWTQTFYGLPSWVVKNGDEKTFLYINQPNEHDLPSGLDTLEWID